MSTDEQNIAISYYIEEIEKQHENDFNIAELMAEIDNIDLNNELTIPQIINYNENYNLYSFIILIQ